MVQKTSRPDAGGPRTVSWGRVAWVSALPPLSALLVSAAVHAGAGGALLVLGFGVDAPVADLQPQAVTVEIITETLEQNEVQHALPAGEPDSLLKEEAAFEKALSTDPEETETVAGPEEAKALPVSDVAELAFVPVPSKRPSTPRLEEKKRTPEPAKSTEIGRPAGEPVFNTVQAAQISPGDAAPGPENRDVRAERRWLGLLAAHLEKRKRYPQTAQSRRQEGTARVRFLVSIDGDVMGAELVGSSGFPDLDDAVLDLLRRASPVPKPPAGVNPLITVPVAFSLKN